jgi:nicotinate-nucleotide adenylyltransferase
MRLGLFGGSFDPVHRGHLVLADSCARQAALDAVWFVPTARQPLKPSGPQASDAERLAMLRLALTDRPRFEVSALEIERGGASYTVDTLTEIHAQLPEAELYFLMGADSLADFLQWRRPEEICSLATPLVVRRAGSPAPNLDIFSKLVSAERLDAIRRSQVEMPTVPISSSQIRQLIAVGGDWKDLLPATVAEYIREKRLYLESRQHSGSFRN